MSWTKKDRVEAVINGEIADRPPITAYHHFPDKEHDGARLLADTLLAFQKQWDWDFVKINSRAVYYNEAWGNTYDYNDYSAIVMPAEASHVVYTAADLEKINEMTAKEEIWQNEVRCAQLIVDGVKGEVPVFATVFTPASTLMSLCGQKIIGRYRKAERAESLLIKLIKESPEEIKMALKNIALTTAHYCEELRKVGITGLFYAELGMARSGYLTEEEWKIFVKPYDFISMEPVRELPNIVHTCGIYGNPEWFTDYPCRIIHWAQSAPGTPKLKGSTVWLKGKIPMGGCDERPFGQNKAAEIDRLCRQTINDMKDVPFIMAPECSVDPRTSFIEIKTFRDSVEKY